MFQPNDDDASWHTKILAVSPGLQPDAAVEVLDANELLGIGLDRKSVV